MGFGRFIGISTLTLLCVGCAGDFVYASGPYSGRVVDAETRQPLVGSIVLVIWMKYVPVGAHMPREFVAAVEVSTDENGEFQVPRQRHVVIWGSMDEPDFVIFHPDYGYFPMFQVRPTEGTREVFRKHTLVELPRWKTREERLRVRDLASLVSKVPAARMPKLVQQINAERESLGLKPEPVGR